jgi:hypothetical protein
LLWIAILLAVAGAWSAGARRVPPAIKPGGAAAPFYGGEHRAPEFLLQLRPPRVDLYGNPIDAAVGDYRLDPRGDMYERHSPDTAVTRLAAPSL